MFYEIQLYLIVVVSGAITMLQFIKNINENKNKKLDIKKDELRKGCLINLELYVDNGKLTQK